MLRIIFLSLLVLGFSCDTKSQIQTPAKITAVTPEGKFKVGDVIELIFNAEIQKGWYIYTVGFDPDCGPLLTEITLDPSPGYELVGDLVAVNDKAKHDKIFDCDVRIFEDKGEFRQKVRILAPEVQLKGSYEGQVCAEQCVLFSGDLFFSLIKAEGKAVQSATPVVTPQVPATKEVPSKAPPIKIDTATTNDAPIEQSDIAEDHGSVANGRRSGAKLSLDIFFPCLSGGACGPVNAVCVPHDTNDGQLLYGTG
jgi:thiol:disulfide interchange protein DsbD